MRFREAMRGLSVVYLVGAIAWFCLPVSAGIEDRVVAFVDTGAITLSELEKTYAETVKAVPTVTREDVLNTMINRLLLVREARRMRLKPQNEDALVKEYIDLRVRAFIRVGDDDIKQFYDAHRHEFQGKDIDEVRDDIEKVLVEEELNKRLRRHLDELRGGACVVIQLDPNAVE